MRQPNGHSPFRTATRMKLWGLTTATGPIPQRDAALLDMAAATLEQYGRPFADAVEVEVRSGPTMQLRDRYTAKR